MDRFEVRDKPKTEQEGPVELRDGRGFLLGLGTGLFSGFLLALVVVAICYLFGFTWITNLIDPLMGRATANQLIPALHVHTAGLKGL